MTPEEYQALVKRMAPRSPILRDTALAFLVGGAICVVGQLLSHWYGTLGLDASDAGTATSVTLVFLSALATGLGLYHKLARWAGAGTLVPITGFANAVASPAVDFQTEGLITGTAVKMFTVAAGHRVRHRRQRGLRSGTVAGAAGVKKRETRCVSLFRCLRLSCPRGCATPAPAPARTSASCSPPPAYRSAYPVRSTSRRRRWPR